MSARTVFFTSAIIVLLGARLVASSPMIGSSDSCELYQHLHAATDTLPGILAIFNNVAPG